jgi:hypothetical protein
MKTLPARRIANRSSRLRGVIPILAAFILAGCATGFSMMPTPNLYTGPQAKPLFIDAPADVRTPPLDLLFVTDRAPAASAEPPEPYTADRSRSLAFGSTTVLFGEGVTWDTLVRLSTERTEPLMLKLGPTKELGRFPPIPYGVIETAGGKRGILFGYDVDYESSVYAVEHLRKTIRTIATTPGVERIHLVAHSRGTDLLATAMSDLTYEA